MNIAEELIESLLANPDFVGKFANAVGQSGLLKADAFTTGPNGQQLVWYDLEPSVKFLYPFLKNVPLIAGAPEKGIAPLARVPANGGTATHWKTITAIDINNIFGGVGRGQRGAPMSMTTNDLSSPYFGMGGEVPVDFETRYEAVNLVPEPLEIAQQSGLRALMMFEEKCLIGGNNSLALGTTPTPTVTDGASSGGSMSQGGGTLSVICVALTNDGYLRSSVTSGVPGSIARQNMDGSTLTFGGGSANKSANGTLSLTSGHTALATVTPVSGAVAYAWFWGAVAAEKLGAITTIAGIELKADAAGTQLASALTSDQSKNPYIPDGIITQMVGTSFGSASNSYVKYVSNGTGAGGTAGTVGGGNGLTGDGAGGIVEFDAVNLDRWNNYRMGITRWLVNAQEANNLTKKILLNPSGVTSLFRMSMEYDQNGLKVGKRITSYHNKFTGEDQDIVIHPIVPPGTVIGWTDKVPYPLANVTNIIQAKYRQGYYSIPWPLSTRQYQYGIYVDETFENYFTPAFTLLSNLGNN
jgi:hypothetical protein